MRIKRRDFLKASAAAGAVAALGGLKLNAFAASKEQEKAIGGTGPGEWIASTCQGCTAWCPVEFFVQEGRASRCAATSFSKANNGYCLPARSPDAPAGLRSGPDQGADEAHQPRKGARYRSQVRPDHLGRGAGYHCRQDDGAAQDQRAGETDVHARPLLPDLHRSALRHTAQDLRHPQLLLPQRHLRRGREDGPRLHPGVLRLPRLRPGQDQVPGDLGLRPAQLQPPGAQRHQQVRRHLRPRYGHRRRSRVSPPRPPRPTSGSPSNRARTAPWPRPWPMSS